MNKLKIVFSLSIMINLFLVIIFLISFIKNFGKPTEFHKFYHLTSDYKDIRELSFDIIFGNETKFSKLSDAEVAKCISSYFVVNNLKDDLFARALKLKYCNAALNLNKSIFINPNKNVLKQWTCQNWIIDKQNDQKGKGIILMYKKFMPIDYHYTKYINGASYLVWNMQGDFALYKNKPRFLDKFKRCNFFMNNEGVKIYFDN